MIGTFAWVSFPFGILIGYLWRDRISKARAARYWDEHKKRHQLQRGSRQLGAATLTSGWWNSSRRLEPKPEQSPI